MSLSCFLLVDPRQETLDPVAVQDLAHDLQVRLFGSSGAGEVELIMFEGESEDIARFASLDQTAIRRIADGEHLLPPLAGSLTRITAATMTPVVSSTRADPDDIVLSAGRTPPQPQEVNTPVFQGLYFAAKQTFLGNVLCSREIGFNIIDRIQPNTRDQARHHDHSLITLASEVLRQRPRFSGMIYLPLCYTPLIHGREREDYKAWLNTLPAARRHNLAVAVYDTPRDPSFTALLQIKAFLDGYFKVVDLQTFDPDFAVERLTPGLVQSVTLVLPEAGQAARNAAIRRFADRMDMFRVKRIWPAISNIRSTAELQACLARRIPFVSGRAVAPALTHPVGAVAIPSSDLPIDDRRLVERGAAGHAVA